MKSKAGLLKNLLKLVGYCKSILKQDVEDLVRRTDLEEETILDNENIERKNLLIYASNNKQGNNKRFYV
jgi:hypothetical protein